MLGACAEFTVMARLSTVDPADLRSPFTLSRVVALLHVTSEGGLLERSQQEEMVAGLEVGSLIIRPLLILRRCMQGQAAGRGQAAAPQTEIAKRLEYEGAARSSTKTLSME
jgi:hypothetical protein